MFGWARREPLVWFLALGFALFGAYNLANRGGGDADDQIVVDQDRLVAFIQSRQPNLDDTAYPRMEAMTPAEMRALVAEYIREETMYREAAELGLGDRDYLIRRRLASSLDFLFRNMEGVKEPTAPELRAYYENNAARYTAAPGITFTHIFYNGARRGWGEAELQARNTLADIERRGEAVVLAAGWPGDRFAYHLNYAERDKSMIVSHFGPNMADALFAATAAPARWQGPFRSTSGVHLVRIEQLAQREQLPYAAVAAQVRRDLIEARRTAQADAASTRLRAHYVVRVSDDVRQRMDAKGAAK
jgi:hypothetical protein